MAEDQKNPIVILPGWGGSQETWKEFAGVIKDDFSTVHVIDLPCFGSEPSPKEVWGVEEYATFVEKKITALGLSGRCIIFGHSFGGQVAAYLAGTRPRICAKLILAGAAVFRQRRPIKRFLFSLIAKFGKLLFEVPGLKSLKTIAQKLLYQVADSPDYLKTAGVQRQIFQKVIRQDVSEVARAIQVPTLLIWGDQDTYVPLRYGKCLLNYIPQAKFVMIKGGRHGLHHTHQKALRNHIVSFTYTTEHVT